MSIPKIYLAGPDVFSREALALGAAKKALCAQYGFLGLYPLDNELALGGIVAPEETGLAIYRGNCRLMQEADLGIANLTPFRGPSADAGTVFEVGYMTALGKPVYGYSNEPGPYIERARIRGLIVTAAPGEARDAADMLIEDFGMADNLMILGGVLERAEHHVIDPGDARRWSDLSAFETCLQRAAARYGEAASQA